MPRVWSGFNGLGFGVYMVKLEGLGSKGVWVLGFEGLGGLGFRILGYWVYGLGL